MNDNAPQKPPVYVRIDGPAVVHVFPPGPSAPQRVAIKLEIKQKESSHVDQDHR